MGDYLLQKWLTGPKDSKSSATSAPRLNDRNRIVRDQRTKEEAPDLRNAIVDAAFHKAC